MEPIKFETDRRSLQPVRISSLYESILLIAGLYPSCGMSKPSRYSGDGASTSGGAVGQVRGGSGRSQGEGSEEPRVNLSRGRIRLTARMRESSGSRTIVTKNLG